MVETVDYWREVIRRAVLALGFAVRQPEQLLVAELIGPQEGAVRRAAFAAIELHKLLELEPLSSEGRARTALLAAIPLGPATLELARYQDLLVDRLWVEVSADPISRLEALAYPHE